MEPIVLPVTDEFKRKRRLAIIVTTVAVIISVTAFIGTSSYSVKTVNILSVELVITYENSSARWLGPQTQFLTANYETLDGGSNYSYSISLTDSSSTVHHLDSITSETPGFDILSLDPQTPIAFEPGQSFDLNILIHLPNYNFVGVLSLAIVAS